MNLYKISIIIFFIFISCSCSNEKKIKYKESIDFSTFKIIDKNVSNLPEIGKITKVIELETVKDSLIGSIDRIIIDDDTGDFIVGDFRSGKKVRRFAEDGKYLRTYGRFGEGPGEYIELNGFTSMPNGDVILLAGKKMIKLSQEGKLLKEVKCDYYLSNIESIENYLYLHILQYRKNSEPMNAIKVMNSSLEVIDGFGEYDLRLKKFMYTFDKSIAKYGHMLYFIDHYNFKLSLYNPRKKQLSSLTIPGYNSNLEPLWNKKLLELKDQDFIIQEIHRFDAIFAFRDSILLSESQIVNNIFNFWLLNIDKKEVIIFPYESLRGKNGIKIQEDLFFNRIAGSFENGVIGVFDDSVALNRYKHKFPMLKDIEFKEDDNPILVFFQFTL